MRETELYQPVKTLLEGQGYEVKGEVGAADIVAVRGDEPPVIVELKTAFSLSLFHQAIERLKLTDAVYIAVPYQTGRKFYGALKANTTLCRRLGIGLITVRLSDGFTQIHLDPGPYAPRKSAKRKERLLQEFEHRVGDPNAGGMNGKRMTAYRQDALRCLKLLNENGPTKAAIVAKETQVDRARQIMADDHYGWFERVETGIYAITPNGEKALVEYRVSIEALS